MTQRLLTRWFLTWTERGKPLDPTGRPPSRWRAGDRGQHGQTPHPRRDVLRGTVAARGADARWGPADVRRLTRRPRRAPHRSPDTEVGKVFAAVAGLLRRSPYGAVCRSACEDGRPVSVPQTTPMRAPSGDRQIPAHRRRISFGYRDSLS